ncbi:MAG: DsrE family protein [Betaproteobacteria bacterium]|nr:DsrE family protein [Betaproteobacteria bacterium]
MRQALAVITLIAGLAGFTAATPALAAGKTSMTHIVMQVSDNDPAKWQLALNNAENVRAALGKKVAIEIVAYGPGLNMLKADSKVAAGLNAALDNNVELAACGVTMKKMNVTKADLIGGATVVPGGVIEIMKRQSEGWSYVRP